MSFTPENELAVRAAIAEKVKSAAAPARIVLPSPSEYADKADFFATNLPKTSRNDIESTPVEFACVYPLHFLDDPKGGGQDEPLILFTYEIYLFSERTFKKSGESGSASDFEKKLSKTHTKFVADWLSIRSEFLGKQILAALSGETFAVRQTNGVSQGEFINSGAECEFVPGVRGFEVRLQLEAKILVRDC